jgi:PAS domain S-box-containing protein
MLPDTSAINSRLDSVYLITREFSARLDIDQVLERVLSATAAAVGASDASLLLYNEEDRPELFLRISGRQIQRLSQATLTLIDRQGLAAWVKTNRQAALVKDTTTDPRWFTDSARNSEIRPAHSAIAAPIQLPEQLIGVITITSTKPQFFGEDDLAMLSIIADQAAFAISNARLFKAEQRRRRLADTLASVARTLNSTLDLQEVLNLILDQLALVIEHDSSSIQLFEGDMLVVQAARGFEDMQDALQMRLPVDESVPNYRAIVEKVPIFINDIEHEPGWRKTPATEKVRSWIGAPLVAQDEVVGMLTIDSFELNKYTTEDLIVVSAFADQVATAVANAQTVAMLRNMEDSYTRLFEDSADMIIITDYRGRILNANRKGCQMLRRTKDALIGNNISLVDRQLAQALKTEVNRLKSWRDISLEVDVLDAYRQPIPLEINARNVRYGSQSCVQWVGRDISARRETDRMRQDLINMLVHDLRGPVGNLINTIELLPMLLGAVNVSNPKIERFLDLARRSGQEVRDLVDSMLDVSRLEGGEIYLQRSMVNLDELLQVVNDQVTQRAMSKEMELIIEPTPADMPEVWLDQNMIRRVLINLVDNAIKYTPAGGRVALTSRLEDETLRLAISDNGPGISPADQARIFKKFSRVDRSANAPSGVGLGLAFCKLAVEAHNGQIWIESEGIPGQGSTFHVALPILTPSEE